MDDSEFRCRKIQVSMLLYGVRPEEEASGQGKLQRFEEVPSSLGLGCSGHRARELPRPRRAAGSRQGISKFALPHYTHRGPSRVNHLQTSPAGLRECLRQE